MPIIREYRCNDCSTTFESMDAPADAACPACTAGEPERVFLTAPAIRSGQTSTKDNIVKGLAADYGLSDISNRNGQAVKQAPTGPTAAQFAGGGQVMQKLASLGSQSDNFSPVLGSLRAMGGPRSWAKTQGK